MPNLQIGGGGRSSLHAPMPGLYQNQRGIFQENVQVPFPRRQRGIEIEMVGEQIEGGLGVRRGFEVNVPVLCIFKKTKEKKNKGAWH